MFLFNQTTLIRWTNHNRLTETGDYFWYFLMYFCITLINKRYFTLIIHILCMSDLQSILYFTCIIKQKKNI